LTAKNSDEHITTCFAAIEENIIEDEEDEIQSVTGVMGLLCFEEEEEDEEDDSNDTANKGEDEVSQFLFGT